MKKTTFTAALAWLLIGSTAVAAPFMAVGSSAELFVTANVAVEVNDNLTLGSSYIPPGQPRLANPVRDDTVLRFAPGLSFEFGRNALVSGRFAYVESFSRHSDNSDLDSELSDVMFDIRHQDEKSKSMGKMSYRQLNQNTVDLRSPVLSRRDVFDAAFEHEMEFTAKSSLSFGFDYSDTDYHRRTFVDQQRTQLPVRAYYELTPKVDMSFTMQYREVNTDLAAANATDWFYALGARGEFTPKLVGYLRLGVTDRDLQVGSGRTTFGFESNFDYLYSEKTTLTMGASNDFGTSGTGANQENFDAFIGMRSKISPEFTVSTRLAIREIDYFTRPSDSYLAGSISGDYTFNEYLTLRGSFNYQENSSGQVGGDFDNSVFTMSARLRY